MIRVNKIACIVLGIWNAKLGIAGQWISLHHDIRSIVKTDASIPINKFHLREDVTICSKRWLEATS